MGCSTQCARISFSIKSKQGGSKGNLCKTEKVAYLPREEEVDDVTINIDFLFMDTLHHEIVGLYCRGKRFSVADANVKNST